MHKHITLHVWFLSYSVLKGLLISYETTIIFYQVTTPLSITFLNFFVFCFRLLARFLTTLLVYMLLKGLSIEFLNYFRISNNIFRLHIFIFDLLLTHPHPLTHGCFSWSLVNINMGGSKPNCLNASTSRSSTSSTVKVSSVKIILKFSMP